MEPLITIKATNIASKAVAYICQNDDKNWFCSANEDIFRGLIPAGITTANDIAFIELKQCSSPDEALAIVTKYGSALFSYELMSAEDVANQPYLFRARDFLNAKANAFA